MTVPHHAAQINAFCAEQLSPYLNFHRPCLFAKEITDTKGRIRKRSPQHLVMTPFDKLAGIAQAERLLKPGVSLAGLRAQALSVSDNEAAARLNAARNRLFLSISKRSRSAA